LNEIHGESFFSSPSLSSIDSVTPTNEEERNHESTLSVLLSSPFVDEICGNHYSSSTPYRFSPDPSYTASSCERLYNEVSSIISTNSCSTSTDTYSLRVHHDEIFNGENITRTGIERSFRTMQSSLTSLIGSCSSSETTLSS
jgi:hypothetical protein